VLGVDDTPGNLLALEAVLISSGAKQRERAPGAYAYGDPISREVVLNPDAATNVVARYFNAYRLAAYALTLYAMGHTLGAVVSTPAFGPESDAVVASMKTVRVVAMGADCTWYGFYRGFGIFVSIFFVFSAVVAWQLGGNSLEERVAFAPLTWALFASYAVSIGTAWLYFFPMPLAFSILVTLLLGVAGLRDLRLRRKAAGALGAR